MQEKEEGEERIFSLLLLSVLLCQPVAVHLLRPADAKHVHQLVAVTLGPQAEVAARQRHPAVLGAHGGVEGAQEGPEVWGALEVHHGVEGLQVEQRDRSTRTLVSVRVRVHVRARVLS